MNFTELSLKYNRVSILLFAIVVLFGLITYMGLPQDSMPPYTVRVANVVTQFPGAGPERVEELVTKKVEQKIQEVPEIKEITSVSRENLSVVTITLRDDIDPEKIQGIWDLIRRKLETVSYPDGSAWELKDDGLGVVYGIVLGLVTDSNVNDEMNYSYAYMGDLADDLKDRYIQLEDAAKVEISGKQTEQIFVEYDNDQLAKYGLTAAQLEKVISGTNILFSGGAINVGDERLTLEPTGNFDDINQLKRTIVRYENQQVLYLEDIATVTRGYQSPATEIVKSEGKPALGISISLKEGSNIVELGKQVNELTEEIKGELPLGLELKRLSSLDSFVDNEVNNFINNLIQTVVIVLLVMLIFLGVRTGFIIASLIPMVILATFLLMGVLGQGINQVTLAALIMALGMMVDNGVVVSETILVKLDEGKEKWDAIIEASKELIIPLLISTLTTSVAFLSFFLAESNMGDIVGPLFVIISVALVCSWLFSLSMTTMLSYYFLKQSTGESKKPNLVDRIINYLRKLYNKLIVGALRVKTLTLLCVLGMFILSLFLFRFIPFIFMPDSERNLVTVDINLPEGTRIEATGDLVESIEQYIKDSLQVNENREKGVLDWSSFVGSGPESYDLGYQPDEPNSNYAHMLVNTSSGDDNGLVISKLDKFSFDNFPTANIKVSRLKSGGGGVPIEIKFSGENPDILANISEQVKSKLAEQSGTKNIKDDWGPKTKKIVIDIDPLRAENAGVNNQDIALSLYTSLNGFDTGDFREDDKSISIIMRDQDYNRLEVQDLDGINIYSQSTGKNVPLAQVANVRTEWQYAKIAHYNQKRSINVSSEIGEGGNASKVMSVINPWLTEFEKTLPAGYSYELGGDSKDSADNMMSVAVWLPMCGFIIVLLLIIQFNSMRKMAIVVTTIPLGVIGVIIGLLVLRSYFGFFAFLGIISLAGIIINNAIMLVDRIDIERGNGLKLNDAVIEACLQRFRPILLTTFTTVLGMIPLYLGGGLMWQPLAAAIMVGLLFGTLITLVFVPVSYSSLFKDKKVVEKAEV